MAFPSETVTFLFTDIEGSTKLWEKHPQAMRQSLARHDALLRHAIADNNGVVFKTVGDAFCAAFATAPDALNAALQAQLALKEEFNHREHRGNGEHGEEQSTPVGTAQADAQAQSGSLSSMPAEPPSSAPVFPVPPVFPVVPIILRVRMALHTGAAELRDGDYFGQPLNRVARLLVIGYGGQTLVSAATQELTRDTLPPDSRLQDLGEHRLRDLSRPETVFQLLHPALPSEFPPLRSLDNPDLPNNLPRQVTSFIGREKEMGEVRSLLDKTRLLTLTGSGGCGKTRLGLQVAADALASYPDGAWLAELAPLPEAALVPQTLAQTLGVTEQAGRTPVQALVEALKSRRMLIVLDNCEHVLDACARLVDALLRACPHLKILASSREALGIVGETVYRIPSLSLPDPRQAVNPATLSQYEAVRLFVERAAAALPSFAVTNANAPALASLCHRLDGIPLAIELAAARVRSLSLEEINSRLDNRFRLLTGGNRTALPRQQTLRALIDWSYDLLNEQEKTLLCRLSVFAGGWTLEAAEQVGAGAHDAGDSRNGANVEEWEIVDLLTSLADKSLVLAQTSEETTRYRLLETVRQYARDRLAESGESGAVRARHGDCFLTWVEEVKPKLNGPEQARWLDALEEEHDNLRQALTYYAEDTAQNTNTVENAQLTAGQDTEALKGLRLGAALQGFWMTRGYLNEGRERLAALLASPGGQEPTKARADALNGAGGLAQMQGDYAQARVLHEESLAIRRLLGDLRGMAISLSNLGGVAYGQGDYAQERILHEQSLAIARQIGNQAGIAHSLSSLGNVASMRGDYAQAQAMYEESLAIRRALGDKRGIAISVSNLGNAAQAQGGYGAARVLHEESLHIRRELGDQWGIALSLNNLGDVAFVQGDYGQAQALHKESLEIRRALGDKEGAAISLINLGHAACGQGDLKQAHSLYAESLTIVRGLEDRRSVALCLEAFASLAVKEAQGERAARLWGAAAALRETMGSPLPPLEREEQAREQAPAQQALGQDAFARVMAQGRAMTPDQAIEYALERDSGDVSEVQPASGAGLIHQASAT